MVFSRAGNAFNNSETNANAVDLSTSTSQEQTVRNGTGKKTYADGVYDGEFSDFKRHGRGEKIYSTSGGVYRGEWQNDKKHGKGTYIYADGVYYGQFEDDKRNGIGKKNYTNGDDYEGEWRDDKRHGEGKYIWSDGTVYNGEWEHHNVTGKGEMIFTDGVYYGEFKDGKRHGFGKKTYNNGDEYEGEWREGKKHGKGKRIYAKEDSTYFGEWQEGVRGGKGQINYSDRTTWYGHWENDEKATEIAIKHDVFLAHNWGEDEEGRDNHARVSIFNDSLKNRGLSTWFDAERLQGNIIDQMTLGIDGSMSVIVFVTEKYMNKVGGKGTKRANDNCKMEFEYAMRRKGVDNLFVVVMEKACKDQRTWEGTLGAVLGSHMYHTFVNDGDLDKCVTEVCEKVEGKRIKAANVCASNDRIAPSRRTKSCYL